MDGIPETLTERNKYLLYKHEAGQLTSEEALELDECCRLDPDMLYLKQLLDDKQFVNEYIANVEKAEAHLEDNMSKAWARIAPETPPAGKVVRVIHWQPLKIAGVLLPLIVVAVWLFSRYHPKEENQRAIASIAAINTGSNRATLSLAVGQRFILNGMTNGKIWKKGAYTIVKSDSGLQYINDIRAAQQIIDNPSITQYDTLETPRGGQFSIVLSDGSRVQLNAESKLIFPPAFTGDHRQVQLIGEGYFKVAENSRQPFIVQLPNNDSVEVLGTSFNISAYTNDRLTQTTLLTGKVRVKNGNHNKDLSPNDQLTIGQNGVWQLRKGIDAEAAIAWTFDEFNFNGDSLSHALRQIARWYDKDLVIIHPIEATTLHGSQSRQKPLPILLKAISINTIDTFFHFQVEGQKIFVRP